jgi:hypothetical protein
MADVGKNALTTYSGDGSTTSFLIGFPYLRAAHILVTEDAASQVLGTDYTVSTDGLSIDFVSAPPATTTNNVVFRRVTPREALVFDPTAGSGVKESEFVEGIKQGIYVGAEAEDKT